MPSAELWRPGADLAVLRARAQMLQSIRQFFQQRQLLEVDLPVLSGAFGSDLCIEPISAVVNGHSAYLQSSPEFFLKRLLAAGSGDVFALGRAFRDHERGRRHNPEFTLLEWYRCGWDQWQLMQELQELVLSLLGPRPVASYSYAELFVAATGLDPHDASDAQLLARAKPLGEWVAANRAACLDLLFAELVEPALPSGLVLIWDFPLSHSALAELATNRAGQSVACRFELYCDGVELANGYRELTDAAAQRQRFSVEIEQRRSAGQAVTPLDEHFLAALESGLPPCAGVAVGVDRLLMCQLGCDDIDEVLPFSWRRCR